MNVTATISGDESGAADSSQPRIAQPAPAKTIERHISSEEEDEAINRATDMLENEDIAAARLIYESIALRGSAKGAFAMAQTFDPQFLKHFVINGLKPNLDEARMWYQKATELGSSEAEARLATLDPR